MDEESWKLRAFSIHVRFIESKVLLKLDGTSCTWMAWKETAGRWINSYADFTKVIQPSLKNIYSQTVEGLWGHLPEQRSQNPLNWSDPEACWYFGWCNQSWEGSMKILFDKQLYRRKLAMSQEFSSCIYTHTSVISDFQTSKSRSTHSC